MQLQIISTEDHSKTIYVPELNERYHSCYGAIQESQHIYIEAGMNFLNKKKVTIFEMGFGTGLNAYLSYINAAKHHYIVNYYSIEKFPLPKNIYSQLNYPELVNDTSRLFSTMHKCEWNKNIQLSDYFTLNKIKADINEFTFDFSCHLVYFDAFGPDIQPEVWQEQTFKKIIDSLSPNGILTTYSSKGTVKRALKNLGMQIETIPGPKGKRNIIRAVKN